MRVVIRFDVENVRDRDFFVSIIQMGKDAGGKVTIIGPAKGVCISKLTWIQSFSLGADIAAFIRDNGNEWINEAELRMEYDPAEGCHSTFSDF